MIRVEQRDILICDGCGTEFGTEENFSSALDARAAAYKVGWRYPPRHNNYGLPSKMKSDVCPACAETWHARPAQVRTRPPVVL